MKRILLIGILLVLASVNAIAVCDVSDLNSRTYAYYPLGNGAVPELDSTANSFDFNYNRSVDYYARTGILDNGSYLNQSWSIRTDSGNFFETADQGFTVCGWFKLDRTIASTRVFMESYTQDGGNNGFRCNVNKNDAAPSEARNSPTCVLFNKTTGYTELLTQTTGNGHSFSTDDFSFYCLRVNATDNTDSKAYFNATEVTKYGDLNSDTMTWTSNTHGFNLNSRYDYNTGTYLAVGHDIIYDELSIFNGTISEDCIDFLYNNHAPTSDQQYPFSEGVVTSPTVTLNYPTGNLRANTQPDINFTVTDNDNATLDCDLYVDASINLSNTAVANNTVTTFNPTFTNGVHSYYISCTDAVDTDTSATLQYDFDDNEPFIQSSAPNTFNSTIFTGFTMNVVGNVTDDAIWRVNRTIYFPNSTVLYNNYSGNLPNVSIYSWDDTFNTTLYPNGQYEMNIVSTDPHTTKYFPEAKQLTVDNDARKLVYEFDDDTITVQFVAGNVFGQFDNLTTVKLDDRYTFEYHFKNLLPPNSRMTFRLTSLQPITYLPDSVYNAHFILADKYWVDFEGVEATYEVTQVNETSYEVEITTANQQQFFKFESLGGLNEDEVWIEFQVNNCVPDWSCIGFTDCNTSDKRTCNETTDNNACGLAYGGDYSEFGYFSCNYCSPLIETVDNITSCVDGRYLSWINITNFATCCNVTQEHTDCYGALQDEPYQQIFISNSSCEVPNIFVYSEEDIAKASINTMVKFVIAFSVFIVVLVIALMVVWGRKRVGKLLDTESREVRILGKP